MRLGYLGIDQKTGEHYELTDYPRKELMDIFDVRSARKMYVELKGGGSRHDGYIVAGHWIRILEVHTWDKK